ncbi:unnamed protein product [Amoebophrya sp. A25]|nr:unnamed protein product [Amoebophrya sp. A25]|eukprot:GSA25T00014305001.1
MLFYKYFLKLAEQQAEVTVELKNDLQVKGKIVAVDQFLNIRLNNVSCSDPEKFPYLLSLKNCFIRGSVLRYVHLNPSDVDTAELAEETKKQALEKRMEMEQAAKGAA